MKDHEKKIEGSENPSAENAASAGIPPEAAEVSGAGASMAPGAVSGADSDVPCDEPGDAVAPEEDDDLSVEIEGEETGDEEDEEDEDNEADDEDDEAGTIESLKGRSRKSAKAGRARTRKAGKKAAHAVDKRAKSLKLISVSSVILFVAIVMVFNIVFDTFLGSKLKWDWSQTNLFSIGDVTKELLKGLGKDIKIIGLYDKGSVSNYADIEILLDEYAANSAGRVTVQYVDPVKTPSILTQVDPDGILKPQEQDFVVWCEANKKAKVLGMYDLYQIGYNQTTYAQEIQGVTAEQAISGAIKYVASEETPVVYMSKGHGETDYTSNFTSMITLIKNNNFLVKDLDLLTAGVIPDDARLIIMLNPLTDITETEKTVYDEYLKKGRSLLVMTEFGNAAYPVLNGLLSEYNIEISGNRVREGDKDRRYQDDAYFFVADLPSGSISESALEGRNLLKNARAITELKNTKEWIKVEPFLQTGSTGIIEENGDPDKAGAEGVVTVGLACENSGYMNGDTVTEPAKVIVVGASSFMDDSIIQTFGTQVYNIYSFYYGLNWLADTGANDLMITAKELPSYTLSGGNNTSFWIATVLCIIVIPLGLLIAALVVYRRRKNM